MVRSIGRLVLVNLIQWCAFSISRSTSLVDFIGWGGLVVAAVGVFLAIYFYSKSRKFKRIAFSVNTETLIEDYSAVLGRLEVLYNGKNVPNLSVSKVVVWNEGNETVRGADIAKADRLCLEANPEVLDTKVVYVTSPANQFVIQNTGNGICVSFEYLDKNQGGIIQLIRSGNLDGNIHLRGSVIGSEPIVRRGLRQRRDRSIAFLIGIVIGAGIAVVSGYLIGLGVPNPLAIGLALVLLLTLFLFVVFRIPTVPSKFESAKRAV